MSNPATLALEERIREREPNRRVNTTGQTHSLMPLANDQFAMWRILQSLWFSYWGDQCPEYGSNLFWMDR
jgi:hypothetical protein